MSPLASDNPKLVKPDWRKAHSFVKRKFAYLAARDKASVTLALQQPSYLDVLATEESDSYYDLKIVGKDGYFIYAHKLVICSNSPFIASMFDDQLYIFSVDLNVMEVHPRSSVRLPLLPPQTTSELCHNILLLSATVTLCTKIFDSMIKTSMPGEITTIFLPDIEIDCIQLILELAYNGTTKVDAHKLMDFKLLLQTLGFIRLRFLLPKGVSSVADEEHEVSPTKRIKKPTQESRDNGRGQDIHEPCCSKTLTEVRQPKEVNEVTHTSQDAVKVPASNENVAARLSSSKVPAANTHEPVSTTHFPVRVNRKPEEFVILSSDSENEVEQTKSATTRKPILHIARPIEVISAPKATSHGDSVNSLDQERFPDIPEPSSESSLVDETEKADESDDIIEIFPQMEKNLNSQQAPVPRRESRIPSDNDSAKKAAQQTITSDEPIRINSNKSAEVINLDIRDNGPRNEVSSNISENSRKSPTPELRMVDLATQPENSKMDPSSTSDVQGGGQFSSCSQSKSPQLIASANNESNAVSRKQSESRGRKRKEPDSAPISMSSVAEEVKLRKRKPTHYKKGLDEEFHWGNVRKKRQVSEPNSKKDPADPTNSVNHPGSKNGTSSDPKSEEKNGDRQSRKSK